MAKQETLLEMAERHVVETRARVERQAALVAQLSRQGRDTAQAQALLTSLQGTLRVMCEVLARQQAREARERLRSPRRR